MPLLPQQTMNSTNLMMCAWEFATFNHPIWNYTPIKAFENGDEDGTDEENIIPHNLVNVHLGKECRYSTMLHMSGEKQIRVWQKHK